MTNSNSANDYGSLLNTVFLGIDGYVIELCPVNKGKDVRWYWSTLMGTSITRCTSEKSFGSREEAFEASHVWWKKYSQYCLTLRDHSPPCLYYISPIQYA